MKIAVFYHINQVDNWENIFLDQLSKIKSSELFKNINYLHIGATGNAFIPGINDPQVEIKKCFNQSASRTLEELWDFSNKNSDYYILYFSSYGFENNTQKETLENLLIFNWKNCVNFLQDRDCVGINWKLYQVTGEQYCAYLPHFPGNHWWTKSSYVNTLDKTFLHDEAITGLVANLNINVESWIGTQKPKVKSLYQNYFDKKEHIEKELVSISETESDIKMNNKTTKIVMMSMFKNEAHTIGRMLESCYKYIDYYVLQDNGSTDGTPEIVAEFFKDKNIPGYIYNVEEGWVSFGWNRDHLLQKVLQTDHGCDWILKMDCDEILVVEDEFDWTILNDNSVQSWHIPSLTGGIFYFRAWMWNARLPWRFNHDTAHETISLEIAGIGENFERKDLPTSFRHEAFYDGQSYGVRTKYLSDALKLEEKLIREETLLTDHYHFWYIGKSYFDCYRGDFYPLKQKHSDEFARRCIFYFSEFLEHTHGYLTTGKADRIDEMGYYALILVGQTYQYLKDYDNAIKWLTNAGQFAPVRNEHLTRLAELYSELGKFDKMYEVTSKLIQPERVNPFPLYHFVVEASAYHNTSNYVYELHEFAKGKIAPVIPEVVEEKIVTTDLSFPQINFKLGTNMKKRLFVVDNFYDNPDEVRNFALNQEFISDIRWYKGQRTAKPFRFPGVKESFESIIGEKITVWEEHGYNGCFQLTNASDIQVYHHDIQKWAGMIYLTPDAPIESGTRLHRAKNGGARHADDPTINTAFSGGFYDSTKFDTVDSAGNLYNRLVLMDARCIHSAGPYFGDSNINGRLIHLFFFD